MRMDDTIVEEKEEYVHFNPTRFCRTDDTGDLRDSGRYFPNFQILYNRASNAFEKINFATPRPRIAASRDDTLTDTVKGLEAKIIPIIDAVGIFYAITEGPGDSVSCIASGTYALYQVNGKRIGITAAHTALRMAGERYFVDVLLDRWRDKSHELSEDTFAHAISGLVEVVPHTGAMQKRADYINSLKPSDKKYEENMDPEFAQCPEPVLDIIMFEVPAALNSYPVLTLVSVAPAPGDLALLLAVHSTTGGRKEADKEYQLTTIKPPNPGDVVYINRSLGVGKVAAVGGIVNLVNSTAHMSSGGPLLNSDLNVFAINLGGFYDNPGDKTKAYNPPVAPWTKLFDGDNVKITVQLPEDLKNTVARKNRTVAINVTTHSGFAAMLTAIAP